MLKLPALLNARTTITTKLTSDSSARTSAVIPLFESVFSVNLYFLYPLRLFLMFFLPIHFVPKSILSAQICDTGYDLPAKIQHIQLPRRWYLKSDHLHQSFLPWIQAVPVLPAD